MRRGPNTNLIWGCAITGFVVLVTILSNFWTPFDPSAQDAAAKNIAPSLQHLFGTDSLGRDVLSRVMEGAATTLRIAFFSVSIGVAAGTVIGGFTGYFGGVGDEIMMRINDAITAFPSILLALVIISLTGHGSDKIIIVLGILFIPSFARVARGEFARQRSRDYVKNARLMGVSNLRIIFVHILPNISTVLLSSIAIGFNNAVLAEASMSFIGLGVRITESASLGYMLKDAQSVLRSAPWQALSAGATIALMVLGFSLISEGLGFPTINLKNGPKRRRKSNA